MNVLKLQRYTALPSKHHDSVRHADARSRKFPQFQQNEIFTLSDAFQRLDVDDRGYLDEATAIKATQQSESQPYDVVRQALKEVELDSSRRVELEDYVGVSVPITSSFALADPATSSLPKSAMPRPPRSASRLGHLPLLPPVSSPNGPVMCQRAA